MIKGFYNLTSGMLTQQRNLNVIANNMVNSSTAGYKAQTYTSSTFDDVIYSRVGNRDKEGAEEIGRQSYIRATSQVYTDYTQGVPEPTGIALDFAIEGDGFFAVRDADGQVAYTRSGSFSLDEEGYLCLPGYGRVLNPQGEELLLATDKITADSEGRIFNDFGGYLGQLGVYDFEDYEQLTYTPQGLFVGAEGQAAGGVKIHWGYLERANVSMVDQMTQMISVQRALQSAAQVTKMYDQLMTKATTDLGRL